MSLLHFSEDPTIAVFAPLSVEPVGDLLERLVEAGVELRITPSLWPLYHAVVASTLEFSIIGMRNARPEGDGRVVGIRAK